MSRSCAAPVGLDIKTKKKTDGSFAGCEEQLRPSFSPPMFCSSQVMQLVQCFGTPKTRSSKTTVPLTLGVQVGATVCEGGNTLSI